MSDVDLLRQVRRLVNKGWCKFEFRSDNDEFCLSGACSHVCRPLGREITQWLVWALNASGQPGDILWFNDRFDTTKDDVLRLIDDAIKLASDKETVSC